MSCKEIYPWQANLLKHMYEIRKRLPHALLLRGCKGIGKFDFALQFTKSLLCSTPQMDGSACGICQSCNWFMQNNHPDFRLLTPEQDSINEDDPTATAAKKIMRKSQISILQVRELENFFALSSHHSGGHRIVLIHPAEALNAASANALLKVLEEPPPDVIFILVTHQPQRLLATITSRCQKIDMPVPDAALAIKWLQENGLTDATLRLSYAGGSPLSVLSEATEGYQALTVISQMLMLGARLDPFITAPKCLALGMELAINTLQKWIYDLINCRLVGEVRYNIQHIKALQALAKSVNLSRLFDFQRKLNDAQKSATHPLNHELQLEELLLQYTQTFLAHMPS